MSLLQDFQATAKTLSKETPDQLGGFMKLMHAVEGEGVLPEKTKHLALVALSVANQCTTCIAVHVNGAVKAGADREEILEAAWLAVLMGGGPKLTYMQYVLRELAENGL